MNKRKVDAAQVVVGENLKRYKKRAKDYKSEIRKATATDQEEKNEPVVEATIKKNLWKPR